MTNANDIISELRSAFSVETDTELSTFLGVDKRTVSSWRNRGKVPDRYKQLLNVGKKEAIAMPPLRWGQIEQHAFCLALFRFTRSRSELAMGNELKKAWVTFSSFASFWFLMEAAKKDLIKTMKEQEAEISTAFTLALNDDISLEETAVARDTDLLDKHSPKISSK